MKVLEALKVIYDLEDLQGGRNEFWNAYRIIEKELKALEIIKNVGAIVFILDKWRIQQVITEEQYDLLNEVLL